MTELTVKQAHETFNKGTVYEKLAWWTHLSENLYKRNPADWALFVLIKEEIVQIALGLGEDNKKLHPGWDEARCRFHYTLVP